MSMAANAHIGLGCTGRQRARSCHHRRGAARAHGTGTYPAAAVAGQRCTRAPPIAWRSGRARAVRESAASAVGIRVAAGGRLMNLATADRAVVPAAQAQPYRAPNGQGSPNRRASSSRVSPSSSSGCWPPSATHASSARARCYEVGDAAGDEDARGGTTSPSPVARRASRSWSSAAWPSSSEPRTWC